MQSKGSAASHVRHQSPTARTPLLKAASPHRSGHDSYAEAQDESSWDDVKNFANPRNWPAWFKWTTVGLVSSIELLSSIPNFMYSPDITDAQADLGTDNHELATFSLTIYVLGFGLGLLLFAPCSELFGRVKVYRCCLLAFLAMTAACGLSQNIEMLIVLRFFAGCCGAAPVAIGGVVVFDLFPVADRGTAMSVYQAGQIIAAILGPPIGGFIGSYLVWRWVFWIVCIATAFALLCTVFILKETHAPTIERSIYGDIGPGEAEKRRLWPALKQALRRPLKLLLESPVILAGCVLIFFVIGLLNIFLKELSRTVQRLYGFSSGQSGLMYFRLAAGFCTAAVVNAWRNDKIMHLLARRKDSNLLPEYRLPASIAAMPLIILGTLLYGWSLHARLHWIVPIVGSGIAGLGITTVQLSVITYMIDSFDDFSASALAAITMARSIGGAILPLVGPLLFDSTGQGWGNSVLALVALLCAVVPIHMYRYGGHWRSLFSPSNMRD